MKKAEISIGVILSVTITIIGIFLLLLYLVSTGTGKGLYCSFVQNADAKVWGQSVNTFCEEEMELEESVLKYETRTINRFSDESLEKILNITDISQKRLAYVIVFS